MRHRLWLAVADLRDHGWTPVVLGSLTVLLTGRWFAGAITLGATNRGREDFALWWTWLATGVLAAWLGSQTLSAPLATGEARILLTGPLSPTRWGLERAALSALASVVAFWTLAVFAWPGSGGPVWAYYSMLEVILMTTLGAALGTRFPPLPALALTLAIGWIGHLANPWAAILSAEGHLWAQHVVRFLPDLDVLDGRRATLTGQQVSLVSLARATGWWMAWMTLPLVLLTSTLRRRDH